ncbi:hypothetical protein GQ600_27052 [Phytophthora cactorum]|nr:hypothetical protein GQ600_27052 [Phytophthora cactorum]
MTSRVKHVFKRYGRTVFIFHSTIFVTTLAGHTRQSSGV